MKRNLDRRLCTKRGGSIPDLAARFWEHAFFQRRRFGGIFELNAKADLSGLAIGAEVMKFCRVCYASEGTLNSSVSMIERERPQFRSSEMLVCAECCAQGRTTRVTCRTFKDEDYLRMAEGRAVV